MLAFIIGLVLYFLIVLSERALVGISPQEVEQLRNRPGAAAQRTVGVVRNIRPAMYALLLARLLLTLLLSAGMTAWLIGSGGLLRTALNTLLGEQPFFPGLIWIAAVLLLALLIAVGFRLLAGVANHSLGNRRLSALLPALSGYIRLWQLLFSPFIKHKEPTPLAGVNTTETPAEKPAPVAETANSGEKRELELLKSIVKFGDVTIKQVMQPRAKVVALDFRSPFDELLKIVRESEFSRLPVFDEDLDNVTGILHVKDLLEHLDQAPDFEWQALVRTNLMLVPESKRAIELLEEFKKSKMHLAIVVDEYGGTSGIITLEDILEEVTGEIRDEFDEDTEVRYRKIDDFNWLFDGQTALQDVCRIVGLELASFDEQRNNADTLAGLVLEIWGDIPESGQEITAGDDIRLTVTAANKRRIEQLKLTLPRLDQR
ncbi:MAG: CBS domain-containing protein [Chitinophagales bacterium]|nr:CBS domain-containing protein [Chitinophagales bacterium]